MRIRLGPTAVLVLLCTVPIHPAGQATQSTAPLPPAASHRIDFAGEVAPLFAQRCLSCHGADRQEGGFRLDRRTAALAGGRNGPVIVPGKSEESRLLDLVAGRDPLRVMPMAGDRLSDEQVGVLRAWIEQGADWPETAQPEAVSEAARPGHWALIPPVKGAVPVVQSRAWVRNPVDAFILDRLERAGLAPSPEADRATLLRRVSLDLIGLPPTPAEVQSFLHDNRPDAYERLVDRLLASPHFGEKWARYWLDVARYADSDGYDTDQLRPAAWRYRDWVVGAFNRDLPFDQFTIQQMAGDLLPHATLDQKVATGFHRNTLSNREGGADLEEFRVEQIADRTSTLGTAWLGLTLRCAQCHDHRYDPILQKDFYRLYAFFNNADEINIAAPLPGEMGPYLQSRPEYESKRQELLAPVREQIESLQSEWERLTLAAGTDPGHDPKWDRSWEVLGLTWGGGQGEGQLEGLSILQTPRQERSPEQQDRLLDYFLRRGSVVNPDRFKELQIKELSEKLEKLKSEYPQLSRAPTLVERTTPRETFVHQRGDFRNPGEPVQPGTPAILHPLQPADGSRSTRLDLARWLVSRQNPLTARVAVNRFWQELFGRGLVATSEDFGVQGEKPSHPELLDWLAVEFMDQGWSSKGIIRTIVNSAAYRQSSRVRPEIDDPDNRLLARQARLRLSAELIRDSALAVSGLLNPALGGPSVRPPQPRSAVEQGFDTPWEESRGAERYRRGLYTFLQRTAPFAQSATFDLPDPVRSCTRRERSNTPLQALTLLNDRAFFEAAQGLALRLLSEKAGGREQRIRRAFLLCLGREPQPQELERASGYLAEQEKIFKGEPSSAQAVWPLPPDGMSTLERAAWVLLSSVLLNLDEFITRQ